MLLVSDFINPCIHVCIEILRHGEQNILNLPQSEFTGGCLGGGRAKRTSSNADEGELVTLTGTGRWELFAV